MRKADLHYELLTLRAAMRQFGVYHQVIYRWVDEGVLHPVKPAGRTLYPSWELEALTQGRGSNPGLHYLDPAAA
ncbi:MAG TPA: helix-turn-helix domain-containing protein [Methylomirabilota bacterium]|nr:helix-turn-helix domain-containing protein [Methylomirabilota bacterium]